MSGKAVVILLGLVLLGGAVYFIMTHDNGSDSGDNESSEYSISLIPSSGTHLTFTFKDDRVLENRSADLFTVSCGNILFKDIDITKSVLSKNTLDCYIPIELSLSDITKMRLSWTAESNGADGKMAYRITSDEQGYQILEWSFTNDNFECIDIGGMLSADVMRIDGITEKKICTYIIPKDTLAYKGETLSGKIYITDLFKEHGQSLPPKTADAFFKNITTAYDGWGTVVFEKMV